MNKNITKDAYCHKPPISSRNVITLILGLRAFFNYFFLNISRTPGSAKTNISLNNKQTNKQNPIYQGQNGAIRETQVALKDTFKVLNFFLSYT